MRIWGRLLCAADAVITWFSVLSIILYKGTHQQSFHTVYIHVGAVRLKEGVVAALSSTGEEEAAAKTSIIHKQNESETYSQETRPIVPLLPRQHPEIHGERGTVTLQCVHRIISSQPEWSIQAHP